MNFIMCISLMMIIVCTLSRSDLQKYLINQYGKNIGKWLYLITLLPIVNVALLLALLVHIDK